MIGGIEIPSQFGEDAHSDGDVLLHALIDAILGAFAMGDIGSFFPPDDDEWKGADSKDLLSKVLIATKPDIINIDSTVTLEKPKLRGSIDSIRESVAALLGISTSQVSVKAKTNERLDSIGTGLAVKAECVVLINN